MDKKTKQLITNIYTLNGNIYNIRPIDFDIDKEDKYSLLEYVKNYSLKVHTNLVCLYSHLKKELPHD